MSHVSLIEEVALWKRSHARLLAAIKPLLQAHECLIEQGTSGTREGEEARAAIAEAEKL